MSNGNIILYFVIQNKAQCFFSDCAAMSMLPLFLIPFVLQFLVHGTNAECAIGDADENAQWINSNGRLKNHDNDGNQASDNDDYFLFQAFCSENIEYDEVDEICNCTFTNSKLQKKKIIIYS
jgi:hypothetical protein